MTMNCSRGSDAWTLARRNPDIPLVWDVVQVDFPFADRDEVRRRPALVVAVAHAHVDFSLLWLAMITGASGGAWPFDVAISDLESSGLLRPCVVRTSKVTAIDARLVGRVGRLAQVDRQTVAEALRAMLGSALPP